MQNLGPPKHRRLGMFKILKKLDKIINQKNVWKGLKQSRLAKKERRGLEVDALRCFWLWRNSAVFHTQTATLRTGRRCSTNSSLKKFPRAAYSIRLLTQQRPSSKEDRFMSHTVLRARNRAQHCLLLFAISLFHRKKSILIYRDSLAPSPVEFLDVPGE